MEQHPWHLHGHRFWVLGHGTGTFVGVSRMKAEHSPRFQAPVNAKLTHNSPLSLLLPPRQNRTLHGGELNVKDPVLRDTVTLYPDGLIFNGTAPVKDDIEEPSGWVVVRYIADRPGAWRVHCHVGIDRSESYMYMAPNIIARQS